MDSDSFSEEIKLEFEETYIKEERDEFEEQKPDCSNIDKTSLIQELLLNEKKRLKMNRLALKKLPKLKKNVVAEKRQRLIEQELLVERKRTFGPKEVDILNLLSTSATVDDRGNSPQVPPTSVRGDNIVKSQVPFTSIRKDNLRKFLKSLSEKEKLNSSQKELSKCVAHMNACLQGHFTLPITILRAIKDCILKRNWNNLTHLLLILIRMPSYRYKHLIRHVSSSK